MTKERITPEEWARRLEHAKELRLLEVECVMCAGSGGWPDLLAPGWLIKCKVCNGTGRGADLSTGDL